MNDNNRIDLQSTHCILIDCDDTLYPQSSGTWEMVRVRINQFMRQEMHLSEDEANALRARLFRQYGTTLRGLQIEYSVDSDAYLNYVHDVPLETVIQPNPELGLILSKLPQQKWVFTNASSTHAQRVLDLLGVASHFEGIVDIYAITPHCKPEVEAFHRAVDIIDEKPEHCLLLDDSPPNLDTAQSLGMQTVSIGTRRHEPSPHINTIQELDQVLDL